MITIDLTTALDIKVPDAKGSVHEYKLAVGLNDVPQEVANHWYVKKFTRPVRRVPRVVVPSSARPRILSKGAVARMAKAIAPAAEGAVKPASEAAPAPPAATAEPAPMQTAEVPAAKEKA